MPNNYAGVHHDLPSVVIIAIDMKHLITLDTENTVYRINKQGILRNTEDARRAYPDSTHSVKPARDC